MENIKNYIKENENRFLEELFGLIRIPSISSESAHKPDILKTKFWNIRPTYNNKASRFNTLGKIVRLCRFKLIH